MNNYGAIMPPVAPGYAKNCCDLVIDQPNFKVGLGYKRIGTCDAHHRHVLRHTKTVLARLQNCSKAVHELQLNIFFLLCIATLRRPTCVYKFHALGFIY